MTALSVFVLLALTGCKALTTNVLVGDAPLPSEPDENGLDLDDLTGSWQMTQDEEEFSFAVDRLSSTTLGIRSLKDRPAEKVGYDFKAIPRQLGEASYLCFTDFEEGEDGEDGPANVLGRYHIAEFTIADSGHLVIWFAHWDNFKKLIGDSFEITETDDEVLLRGTQAQINEFLRTHAEDYLFFYKKPTILQRAPAAPTH